LNADGACPADKRGPTITLENEDSKIFYDAHKAHENKSKFAQPVKKTLTIIFALSNAAGRLAIGFIADPLSSKFTMAPLSVWFVLGSLLNVFVYFLFSFFYPGSTVGEDVERAPMVLYFLTFLAAFSYGGVFTINTSFMKTVVPAEKVGVVLGFSLVILAIGNYSWGKLESGIVASDIPAYKIVASDDVSETLKEPFFFIATLASLFAVIPSLLVYVLQVGERQIAANNAANSSSDFTSTTESSD